MMLKCVIVYLVRDIPAFVMYCVYGASRSSLLNYRVYRFYDIQVQELRKRQAAAGSGKR